MENIRVSDSYDNQLPVCQTLKNSINGSIKPKFIATIEQTQQIGRSSLKIFKKVESFEILKSQTPSKKTRKLTSNEKENTSDESNIESSISKSINLLKTTTVYEDSPINVIELFQKAQRLSSVIHQNKKTIKFLQICEQEEPSLLIQRNDWIYFTSYSGKGILVLPDGRKIKGTWKNSNPVGKVTVHYPNQSMYYGQVNEELQKQGEGYIYFRNGQKLQAQFFMGKMYGNGLYYDSKGHIQKDYQFLNGLLMSSRKA